MDGQLLEQRLLVSVQEVVAPFDEPLQRAAGGVGGRAVTQERRAPLENRDELLEPEHVHACGGELDRERQSVDAPGNLGGERESLRIRLEAGSRRPRALEEELDRRALERRHREPRLARDVERFAARRHDPHSGALREERRRDPPCLGEHVLARVENHERFGSSQPRGHACERVGAANVNGVCEEPDSIARVARAREVDEPCAVGELVLERACRLDREPALAHAGRAGEGHETVLVQERGDRVEVVLAADERRRRRREVAAAPALHGDRGDRRVVREDRLLQAP